MPRAMIALFAVLQVLLGAALVTLVLMHSGRDAGFGGIGFSPASQGGTHIVERNLTRLTVVVAVLFAREHGRALPPARLTPLHCDDHALVAELVDALG